MSEVNETTKVATCGCETRVRTARYPETGKTVIESITIVWPCYTHGGEA